ncbi:MAG: cation diffusion facilitator family transporter, partial [Chitinivibrionales bacterium]|nr:cation diffusion facilitator family transporter [Chitinivibrionales bacterium]
TTGLAIFWDSVNSAYDLLTGAQAQRPIRLFTLLVALATIAAKVGLLVHARSVGTRIQSIAVLALARDHRNDIVASAGAAVGILFGILGYRFLDPVAGALVAIVVAKTGVDILRESAQELMDTVPSRDIDAQIRGSIAEVPEVQTVEAVHAHRFGPYFVANITIGVEGSQTVDKGNEIAHAVEQHLYQNVDMLRKVYIHYHPAHSDSPEEDR